MINRRVAGILCATLIAAGSAVIGVNPAQAHGTGIVKSCKQNTDCTTNSANNAVFAVCDPQVGLAYPCSHANSDPDKRGPRPVTIQLSNFPANTNVYVWFLNSEVDNPDEDDCTQAVGAGRTQLSGSPVATDGSGRASLDASLPPGNHSQAWSYGTNWICATTAATPGSGGTIGDQQFAVYPA